MIGLTACMHLSQWLKLTYVFRYAKSFWPVVIFQLPFCIRALALSAPLAFCVTSSFLPQISATVEIQESKLSSYTPRGDLLSYFLPDKLGYAWSSYVYYSKPPFSWLLWPCIYTFPLQGCSSSVKAMFQISEGMGRELVVSVTYSLGGRRNGLFTNKWFA